MSKKRCWVRMGIGLPLALAAYSVVAQVPLPSIKTHTEAHFKSVTAPDDNDVVNFPVATLPASVTSQSLVAGTGFVGYGRSGVAGLPDIQAAWNDADGWARGQIPGPKGVYARSPGFNSFAGPPDSVGALASVESYQNYLVGGAAPFGMNLAGLFNGFLYTSANAGLHTGVEARITFDVSMDGTLFTGPLVHLEAALNLQNGFTASGTVAGANTADGFINAWTNTSGTMTSINGRDFLQEIDYLALYSNVAMVQPGETIGIKYTVKAEAINSVGPFELFATSDFSHTFDIALSTDTPGGTIEAVNLQTVPEPGSLAGLGLALLVAMRRARR